MVRLNFERGSAIIATLLVITLLLVLGLGLLSQVSASFASARSETQSSQARSLAQAGLVDCQIKISKHLDFPPSRAIGTEKFSYSEDLRNAEGERYGSYLVTIDFSLARPPYRILRVTSVGTVGNPESPTAEYKIYGELDIAARQRDEPVLDNPRFRKWTNFIEQSSPDETSILR